MNREEFVTYCRTFLDLPYVWGSDGPDSYDCSGLAQKLFGAIGLDDPKSDSNAAALFDHFSAPGMSTPVRTPEVGALVFFGPRNRINHVGICIDNSSMIEAAGGGPNVTSPEIARKVGAKVSINPVSRRKDRQAKIGRAHV